jgi:hypothetical protein
MDSTNNIGEAAFKMTNVCHKAVSVILGLLDYFGDLLAADGKIVLEDSCCLLARLNKRYAHLI